MADNVNGMEVTQRKGRSGSTHENETSEAVEPAVEVAQEVRGTWETIKYYFNRFRYYHYVVADTIDLYVSAACLWFINLYFKLFMGVGPNPSSTLNRRN